ncbi:MAG: hypothetical protein HDS68_02915 [Bacteroidales bacterium]|nr:hypothetical protein [Bacteroidales bacterium]
MKKQLLLGAAALCGSMVMVSAAEAEDIITNWFWTENVILPSSEYTPTERYDAQTWVIKGNRYTEDMYNKILGVPADDEQGHKWYELDYELTVSEDNDIEWEEHTSPFSNDEFYKDQPSYRWTESDVMAEIYFRRSFTLNEELPAQNLIMSVGHDDAPAEWYINGVLVHTVEHNWNNGEIIVLSDEAKALIKTDGSENVIAVHVHQNWGGAFADCGLYWAHMTKSSPIVPAARNTKEGWASQYFFPMDNDDLDYFTEKEWYKPGYNFEGEPGCEWSEAFGPYTNDQVNKGTEEDPDWVTEWNGYPATYWQGQEMPIMIRRYFTLTAEEIANIKEEVANGKQLVLQTSYDENPIVYLNGTEIWSTTNWNNSNYDDYKFTAEQMELLQEGENMFAVSLTTGGGGSHIDFGLSILDDDYVPATSGIENIVATPVATEVNDNRIFDLQGRFVGTDMEKLGRGIYIKGGKKVLVNK